MTVSVSAERTPSSPAYADAAVAGMLAALDLRQPGSWSHAERVADAALALTEALDPRVAGQAGIDHAYLLHDLGKLGVPDAITLKPGRLTLSERRIMQTHPTLGAEMIRRLGFFPPLVLDVVESHHERWDARGYPHGLGAWAIPLPARILAVVDAFDAMTHERPYRRSQSSEWARAELKRCAGAQFDPAVVEAFLRLMG